MEQIENQNVTKVTKKTSNFTAVRISKATQKKLSSVIGKVNKKDFGKRIKADDVIKAALDLLTESHIKSMQERSLSNADLLEMKFKEMQRKNSRLTKDEFLGLLLEKETLSQSA